MWVINTVVRRRGRGEKGEKVSFGCSIVIFRREWSRRIGGFLGGKGGREGGKSKRIRGEICDAQFP